MGQKLTTDEFISKANKIHNNLYDYSKANYIDSQSKICIIDPEYGEFWQIPNSHLGGCGCKARGIVRRVNERTMTKEQFVTKAKQIHNNLYDYSKVEYVNAHTQVCIIDPIYGKFQQRPHDHLSGKGSQGRAKNKPLTTETFICRANKIHDNLYDYSKVIYETMHIKICIIDPEYGEFWQIPSAHLRGAGSFDRAIANKNPMHSDHIIPISILGSRYKINKMRPLYKFLDSDINIQLIEANKNIRKGDKIELHGKQIRARHVRNNYSIITNLVQEHLGVDITSIVKEDKKFMSDK